MKRLSIVLFGALLLAAAVACGDNGPTEEELAAEAEAARLDSLSQVMESSADAIEANQSALEAALDSMDALIPEEE